MGRAALAVLEDTGPADRAAPVSLVVLGVPEIMGPGALAARVAPATLAVQGVREIMGPAGLEDLEDRAVMNQAGPHRADRDPRALDLEGPEVRGLSQHPAHQDRMPADLDRMLARPDRVQQDRMQAGLLRMRAHLAEATHLVEATFLAEATLAEATLAAATLAAATHRVATDPRRLGPLLTNCSVSE